MNTKNCPGRFYVEAAKAAVSAYSEEHIDKYIREAEEQGISEHGFARLTANIGFLIAHKKALRLKKRFVRMMDLYCSTVEETRERNGGKVGNDFSVREIVSCIMLLEEKGLFPEYTPAWREQITKADPYKLYTKIVTPEDPHPNNWAMFVAASEQARIYAGMGGDKELIDRQIASQMHRFDENGMYRDPHCPFVYDLVPRALSAFILSYGYDGKYAEELKDALMRSVDITIAMLSVDGEIPFGGRSNQMLMTEGWYAAVCEYYLSVLPLSDSRRGKLVDCLYSAIASTRSWLERPGFSHVKNYADPDSRTGCEGYAYFDKYMATLGSVYILSSMLSSGNYPAPEERETGIFAPGDDFHKLFMNNGSIFVEIDTAADPSYDANGIGRVHFKGIPSALVLSVPCPGNKSKYNRGIDDAPPASICPVILEGEGYKAACEPGTVYVTDELREDGDRVFLSLMTTLSSGEELDESILLDKDRFSYTVGGDGECGVLLPVFLSDGKNETVISAGENEIEVGYNGYKAVYTTDGVFRDTGIVAANRNGRYAVYTATGDGGATLEVVCRKQ